MLQQSVFARVAPQGLFVQLGLNYPVTAVTECLVQMPNSSKFHRAKNALVGHFAKEKVHFFHQYVLLDLSRVKHQRQNALFVQQERTLVFMGAATHQTANYVQQARTAQ